MTTLAPLTDDRISMRQWTIAIVLTMATFMEVLDTTIANVALPHIAGNLGGGQDESTWVLTSYLVSNAIVLPMSGWLSKAIGRKRFYISCVALFTISSLLCGLAPNLPVLIFFRILQGLGGGGLQPSEQAILVDTFPAAKRGMAFAIAGIATICAPVLGPTLGGWITDNYSWRWIFYINVPIGAISMLLSSQILPNPPAEQAQGGTRIDFVGMGFVALGIGALQLMLDKGEREDWFSSRLIVTLAVISLSSLVAAVVWLLRQKDPLVDLRLLKNRNFAIANVMMFSLGFVLFGSTVLIPLMLQTLLGYDATWAGLVLSPGAILLIGLMPISGFLVGKIQPRWLISTGLVITGLALLHMTSLSTEVDYWTAVKMRCLQVIGLPFLFIPINTAAYAGIPPGKNNNASALLSVCRNLGGSVGIAIVSTLLAHRTQFHQSRLVEHVTPYDPAYQERLASMTRTIIDHGITTADATQVALGRMYALVLREASMLAYLDSFKTLATIALCLVPIVALLMTNIDLKKKGSGGH